MSRGDPATFLAKESTQLVDVGADIHLKVDPYLKGRPGQPATADMWLDRSTFLPKRMVDVVSEITYEWLAPTDANREQLTHVVPPEFERVKLGPAK